MTRFVETPEEHAASFRTMCRRSMESFLEAARAAMVRTNRGDAPYRTVYLNNGNLAITERLNGHEDIVWRRIVDNDNAGMWVSFAEQECDRLNCEHTINGANGSMEVCT